MEVSVRVNLNRTCLLSVWEETRACQLSPTLTQLLFSFDQDMRVKKTLIQTLACQLSSTLMQLLFSFGKEIRVEKLSRKLSQSQPFQNSSELLLVGLNFEKTECTVQNVEISKKGSCSLKTERFSPCYKIMVCVQKYFVTLNGFI